MNNPMNDRNDFYSEDFNEDDYYAEEERRIRSEEQIKLYIVAALVLIVVVSSVLIGVIMTKKGINPFGNPETIAAADDDDSSADQVDPESGSDEESGEDTLYSDEEDGYSGDDGSDTYTDDQNNSSDSYQEDTIYQEADSVSPYDDTEADASYAATEDSGYGDTEDSDYDDTEEDEPDEPDELSFEDACLIVLSRKLTSEDINNIKKSAPGNLPETPIQMAINYLYAWHGYHFHTDSIRKYFLDTTWYVDEGRTIEHCEARMDSVEKSNLDKLVALRKQ